MNRQPISKEEFAILILAGGYSKRMGYRKAFYAVSGQPMIKRVFLRVKRLSDEIIISCKQYQEELRKMFPTTRLIVDKIPDKGPIAGLISALPEITSNYVAVLACDSPWIKPDVLVFLYTCARGHDGAILKWPNGFIEPLQAVYRTKKLLEATLKAKNRGKTSLGDVVNFLNDVVYLTPEELKTIDPCLVSFININSPDDVQRCPVE
ncbi:MAG: molybdenum cofactor guanylyltransferase [Candidatus Hadarchaeaceae archaeon]